MKRVLLVVAAALLAGCASAPPPPSPASDETQEVADMLAEHQHMATLKTEEQRREFKLAQVLYELKPTDTSRLSLALTLLLPRAPWRDDERVQSLLSSIAAAPLGQRSARYDLAQLLLRLIAERQQALRDDQHKLDQLAHQLREERRKAEEIQNKLESLRAIDKEMRMRRTKEP